jgi:hypothetical protein
MCEKASAISLVLSLTLVSLIQTISINIIRDNSGSLLNDLVVNNDSGNKKNVNVLPSSLPIIHHLDFFKSPNRVDLIENGWIELLDTNVQSENETSSRAELIKSRIENGLLFGFDNDDVALLQATKFLVKCDRNFNVNSNSNLVRKHISRETNQVKWVPVEGYLNKKLPLCTGKFIFFCLKT